MSHTSRASGSSLLHLYRPLQLDDVPSRGSSVHEDDVVSASSESISCSPSSSIFHSAITFGPSRAGPSMKLDMSSALPVKPPMVRRDTSESSTSESSTSSSDALEGCLDLLRSIKGTTPSAKPKDDWQPDQDTVLCSQRQCSAMFGQGRLALGPRRHHCRYCGLIFCGSHSTRRWPLQTLDSNSRPVVLPLRVCDGCYSAFTEDPASSSCGPTASASSASLATEDFGFSEDEAGSDYEDDLDTPLAQQTGETIFRLGAHTRSGKKAAAEILSGPADWSTF
ncbi:hypothetical protein Q8F55_006477 [Vanrija albida]|uniref:FYVE-type domain-containing protein n=1 Tax=Vanrija albida TaxID=181172 RepID=A0ABR3PXA0_9TREE